MKFKDLKIGEVFLCYGDEHLNYNYPKVCECVKQSDNLAKETGGISFYISPDADVNRIHVRKPITVSTDFKDIEAAKKELAQKKTQLTIG